MNMNSLLMVALGGSIGAVLRYVIAHFTQSMASTPFPIGTLTVNILGCALIGILAAFLLGSNPQHREMLRLLLIIGILGGFTTFSTFALDALKLFQEGKLVSAMLYILLSNVLGILAAWICFSTGKMLFHTTPA